MQTIRFTINDNFDNIDEANESFFLVIEQLQTVYHPNVGYERIFDEDAFDCTVLFSYWIDENRRLSMLEDSSAKIRYIELASEDEDFLDRAINAVGRYFLIL